MQAGQTAENQRKFQDRHLVSDRLKLRESECKFKTWYYTKYINSLNWLNFTPQPADSPFTTFTFCSIHHTMEHYVYYVAKRYTIILFSVHTCCITKYNLLDIRDFTNYKSDSINVTGEANWSLSLLLAYCNHQ